MAESSPAPTPSAEWTQSQSADDGGGISTAGIEFGMSGLDLMSGLQGSSRPPALSGSSASTGGDHSRQHSFSSFPGSLDPSGGTHRGTPPTPDSPLQQMHGQSASSSQGVSRPPGLGGVSIPSPIGKSAPSNNIGTSSPMLSLTPPSSVDGNADYLYLGRMHNSLFGSDAASVQSMPADASAEAGHGSVHGISPWVDLASATQPPKVVKYAADSGTSWNSRIVFSGPGGSFDQEEVDYDDGLHGLVALRERSYSSPGPVMAHKGQGPVSTSTSPPVNADYFQYPNVRSPPQTEGDIISSRNFPSDPRRARVLPRDGSSKSGSRPPLRAGANTSYSVSGEGSYGSSQSDRGFGGYGHESGNDFGASPRYSTADANRGRIAHRQPDSQQQGERVIQNDSYISASNIDHSQIQKFGSLPSLGAHVQQQRRPSPGRSMQQRQLGAMQNTGGHVRSYSQPGLIDLDHNASRIYLREGESVYSGSALTNDMIYSPSSGLSRSVSAGSPLSNVAGLAQGRTSASQPVLSASYEYEDSHSSLQRRHTIHQGSYMSQGVPVQHGAHPPLQRRDALDFIDRQPNNVQVIATREEMQMYGILPTASRSEPQLHNRAHSDGGGVLSSGVLQRAVPQDPRSSASYHAGSPPVLDDDLSHPLVGENIADPGEDEHAFDRPGVLSSIPPHITTVRFDPHHPLHQGTHRSYVSSGAVEPLSAITSLPRVVYTVKFKRTQRNFVAGPRVTRDLEVGCYVKVEADRGEDLGIIVAKISTEKYSTSGRSSFRSGASTPGSEFGGPIPSFGPGGLSDLKRIIRPATHDEVSLLGVKRQEEEELLNVCRTKVRQRALPMHVVDAEYQFDRHKLTFFFEAEGRIDFRELVRDLFSMYKTRIWMQQLDKNTSSGSAALGPFSSASLGEFSLAASGMNESYQSLGPSGM